MDGLDPGVVIGVIALMVLAIVILPIAYTHHRRCGRRGRGDGGDVTVASSAAFFGGDGGGACSDAGGGSC